MKGFRVYDSNFSFEKPTVLSAVILPNWSRSTRRIQTFPDLRSAYLNGAKVTFDVWWQGEYLEITKCCANWVTIEINTVPWTPRNNKRNSRWRGIRWKKKNEGLQRKETPAPYTQYYKKIKSNGCPESPIKPGETLSQGSKYLYQGRLGASFSPKRKGLYSLPEKLRGEKNEELERQVSH